MKTYKEFVKEARVDKLLKVYGDDVIKAVRNKRFLPKIVNQGGATKIRQFQHSKRRGISDKFPNFTPKDTPDKYSKLAVGRKSIHPPTADAAQAKFVDRKVELIKSKNNRRREKERLLRRMFEKGDK